MKRNHALTLDVVHGMLLRVAAVKYGVTPERVRQIVNYTCRKLRVDRQGDPALVGLAIQQTRKVTPNTSEAFYHEVRDGFYPARYYGTPEAFFLAELEAK